MTGPDAAATRGVRGLLDLLALAPAGPDRFDGVSPATPWRRLYGGQVIAQALMAAAATVAADRMPHALHLLFLRPGTPQAPVRYDVERLRDGRAFSIRQVRALQVLAEGEAPLPIATATVSFHLPEPAAFEHGAAMPDVPPPEAVPPGAFLALAPGPVRRYWEAAPPLDWRPVAVERYRTGAPQPGPQALWVRTAAPLPAGTDPRLHAAILAYASDMTLLDTALAPHGPTIFSDRVRAASLDHAMWFHHPADAGAWHLSVQDSPVAGAGRGFARGSLFDRQGRLVASTAQEGVIRAA